MTTTTAPVPEVDSELLHTNQKAKAQRKVGYMAVGALFFTVAAAQLFVTLISLALDPREFGAELPAGLVANYVWWLLICLTGAAASTAYGLRLRRLSPT